MCGAVLGLATACARSPDVPTLRLEPRPFVHKVTADGWLAAETVTPVSVPPQVRTSVRLSWLAPDASQVKTGDVVARFDGGDLQANLATARSAYEGAGFRIVSTDAASVAESAGLVSQREKAGLELALARQFQKHDEQVWSRHEIITAQIDEDLAHDRQRHAVAKQATQKRRTRSDLELLEIEQGQADRKIGEARDGLAALEVIAPHDGLFLRARDWRGEALEVGSQLWRGRPVGEIPDLSRLQARVFVLEADAGGVAAGQSAEVVLENRPDVVHKGKVARVDTMAKPREQGSPVQYFEVTVALEATDGKLMKPGQRARATLYLTRHERALVVPRQAIERVAERHRVYVRKGKGFQPRDVELGAGDQGLVVVTKGLASGDVIALRPPEADAPKGREGVPKSKPAGEDAVTGAASGGG